MGSCLDKACLGRIGRLGRLRQEDEVHAKVERGGAGLFEQPAEFAEAVRDVALYFPGSKIAFQHTI